MLSGCFHNGNGNDALHRLGYHVATVQFLDENPRHAPRMIEVCDATISAMDRGELGTTAAVLVFVRQSIQYQNLNRTEAILLEDILKLAEDQVAAMADAPTLDKVKLFMYKRLTWVRDAAKEYRPRQPV